MLRKARPSPVRSWSNQGEFSQQRKKREILGSAHGLNAFVIVGIAREVGIVPPCVTEWTRTRASCGRRRTTTCAPLGFTPVSSSRARGGPLADRPKTAAFLGFFCRLIAG
jgi:hypothetical protein